MKEMTVKQPKGCDKNKTGQNKPTTNSEPVNRGFPGNKPVVVQVNGVGYNRIGRVRNRYRSSQDD